MRFVQPIMHSLLIASIVTGWTSELRAQTRPNTDAVTNPQSHTTADVLRKLDQLVEQNKQLEKQNQELMDQIQTLRQALAPQLSSSAAETAENEQPAKALASAEKAIQDTDSPNAVEMRAPPPDRRGFGTYTPNFGYKVADTQYGDMSISIYSYVRYLNQLGLATSYTNAFGKVSTIDRRQDFQIQKIQMKFLGWIMDPKLRYFLYAWTSNANQGLGAQVVLAGNLNYTFNRHITFSGGITSLPGTRSVEGNFPFWLSPDSRLITDEFFRPSYTSGIWARGDITKTLRYQTMVGNNLSTLGVSAAQLDNGLNTWASALIWTPTTGEFGAGFGDYENHEQLATRFGAHYTRSHETKESQPSTDAFENTQIRLTDGSVIFTPNLFAPGTTVNALDYRMTAVDGGLKYHGYSLWSEGFFRWLNNFEGPGTSALPRIFDDGLQLQASAMVKPKVLQLYLGGSTVFGKYGHPWDTRVGFNYFPWKNRVMRWNTEALYLYNSPSGYTSVPYLVGSHGLVVHSNWELAF